MSQKDEIDHKIDLLDGISNNVACCNDCQHSQSRTYAVLSHYPYQAFTKSIKILFIGDTPGRLDDVSGSIFIGDAGDRLNTLIESIGRSRKNVFLMNTLHCRPKNKNKIKIQARDMFICAIHTYQQIGIMQPDLIVLLGIQACYYASKLHLYNPKLSANGTASKIDKFRNKIIPFQTQKAYGISEWKCDAIVTYHPGILGKQTQNVPKVEADFKFIAQYIEMLKQKKRID